MDNIQITLDFFSHYIFTVLITVYLANELTHRPITCYCHEYLCLTHSHRNTLMILEPQKTHLSTIISVFEPLI